MQFCPSYSLAGASPLLLNVGYLFLVVSNVILSMAIQQWVVSPSINSITGLLPELTLDWGSRLLEGTNKSLCTPRPRKKEQWTHKRLTRTCPWVSRSLQRRGGSAVACCRVGSTECTGPFEGGLHYLHYLHHSLVSGQTTGREHSPTHQQKIGLNIYWAWPCPSEEDPVSPSVSLSHQKALISLLCLSIRGQTEWKQPSQKTNQSDHMDHSLV